MRRSHETPLREVKGIPQSPGFEPECLILGRVDEAQLHRIGRDGQTANQDIGGAQVHPGFFIWPESAIVDECEWMLLVPEYCFKHERIRQSWGSESRRDQG